MNYINKIILKLLEKLPDWCTGKKEVYEAGFRTKYGNKDFTYQIQKEKTYQLKCYLVIVLLLFLLMFVFGIKSLWIQNKALQSLTRPDYGTNAGIISLKAEVIHGEETFHKKVTLRVRPQSLTEFQKKALLEDCKNRLTKEILGKNKDSDHVIHNLNLKREDNRYPIHIDWSSNRPRFLEEDGTIHRIALNKPVQVDLIAKITLQNCEEEQIYKITILPPQKDKELEEELKGALEEVSQELNNNTYGQELSLPSKLTKDTSLRWYVKNSMPIFPLLAMTLLLMLLIYKRRYFRMERELQKYRDSMRREYPDFINKVVLLLNAGLVITTALERIASDAKGKKDHPLMEAIGEISDNVRESNASFSKELKMFARRSGMRELMRFAAIVYDNLDKGSSLVEKLEAEGELLWMARKKHAEEEGRKAETKLIMPLMVLLLILVIITISPVLIQI
ncbi:MAG: immunoglobulin-like domain-containing protein [Anaerovorax sp.]|nr:immunoglobulin-like domain-containing protein [Anaerovorax sp.]